jgi:hypothetical protein
MSDGISPSSRTSGSNSGEAYDGEADIVRAWARGLAPDPALTVSEWADRYRILSSRASSEAGRYAIGGYLLGDAVANSQQFQAAVGGLVSVGAFAWWFYWERKRA